MPSLRKAALVRAWKRSLREVCERGRFRVVHFSLQRDHAHLLVEAASARDLACGMKSIGARLARAVQRTFHRRGPVLADRYHLRVLRTPREVRIALAYVLLNVRKHWRERHGAPPPVRLDATSSGCWFDGWRRVPSSREPPPGWARCKLLRGSRPSVRLPTARTGPSGPATSATPRIARRPRALPNTRAGSRRA
jgi:REP element-mobilizing transposase RayT